MSTEAEVKRRITLTQEDDVWIAKDEDVNVASHGKTREEALENLDEAVALHKGEGEPVTDEDLREWGIDPDDVPDETQEPEAPWFDE
ncbi:MAG: type II toxin-antitoxin system HicB family antitoxin [Halobacteriales archaeon]|nr:type II toxin-antitoxin system HicB family antitoxin [Halobacteriales archaeon]